MEKDKISKEVVDQETVTSDVEKVQDTVELDMKKFGTLEINSGGNKPKFDIVTKMDIISAVLKTTPDRVTRPTRDGSNQTYYPVFLTVEFAYSDGKETKSMFENYGSGRLFVSNTDGSTFWVGENSALGKLKKLLEENFEFGGTLSELPSIIKGVSVGVMTEKSTVGGKVFVKNIIKVFYK